MKVLQGELNLKIEDMSKNRELHQVVKDAHMFIVDFMQTSGLYLCVRSISYKSEDIHEES